MAACHKGKRGGNEVPVSQRFLLMLKFSPLAFRMKPRQAHGGSFRSPQQQMLLCLAAEPKNLPWPTGKWEVRGCLVRTP